MKKKIIILTLYAIAINMIISVTAYSQNKKRAEDPDEIKNPVINYAELPGSDEKMLYKNCIISLHLAGMDIDPVRTGYGKDIGMIFTDSVRYKIPTDFRASYKLSVIVYKVNENRLAIHIIVINPKIVIRSMYAGKYTINNFNNTIATDIEKFLANLATFSAKAEVTKTTTLDIPAN